MVSTFNSVLSGLNLSPGWGHPFVFKERLFTFTVPLSTLVYKWIPVPVNLMPGDNSATIISSKGE